MNFSKTIWKQFRWTMAQLVRISMDTYSGHSFQMEYVDSGFMFCLSILKGREKPHKHKWMYRYEISTKKIFFFIYVVERSMDSNYIHMHIVLQFVWLWWRRRKRTRWKISWEKIILMLDRLHPIISHWYSIILTRNGAAASTLRINSSVRFGSMDFLIRNKSNKKQRMSEIHTQREWNRAYRRYSMHKTSLLLYSSSSCFSIIISLPFGN